jgi:hypothetical protein
MNEYNIYIHLYDVYNIYIRIDTLAGHMSKTICISYTIDTYPYKAQPLRHVPPGVAGASDSSVLFGLHGVRTTEVALKPVV